MWSSSCRRTARSITTSGRCAGVRGFGDPRPLTPARRGQRVPPAEGARRGRDVTPFHLRRRRHPRPEHFSLDHSWKGSHELWKWHDAWIPAKSALTMGYFTRADLPFYYALADAFTVCDAYHCSIFGPTNPNRMFLFTGTSGLAAGDAGPRWWPIRRRAERDRRSGQRRQGVQGLPLADLRRAAAGRRASPGASTRSTTTTATTPWPISPTSAALAQTRRSISAAAPGSEGSNAANAKTADGDHLVAAFAKDVAADALPQVSWIVAPYLLCEHPSATPADGEALTARLIAALAVQSRGLGQDRP